MARENIGTSQFCNKRIEQRLHFRCCMWQVQVICSCHKLQHPGSRIAHVVNVLLCTMEGHIPDSFRAKDADLMLLKDFFVGTVNHIKIILLIRSIYLFFIYLHICFLILYLHIYLFTCLFTYLFFNFYIYIFIFYLHICLLFVYIIFIM